MYIRLVSVEAMFELRGSGSGSPCFHLKVASTTTTRRLRLISGTSDNEHIQFGNTDDLNLPRRPGARYCALFLTIFSQGFSCAVYVDTSVVPEIR